MLDPGTYRYGGCFKPGQDLSPGVAAKARGPGIGAPRVVRPSLGQIQIPGQITFRAAEVRDSLQKGLFKREIVFLQEEKASVRKDELSVNQFCQGSIGRDEFRGNVKGECSCSESCSTR